MERNKLTERNCIAIFLQCLRQDHSLMLSVRQLAHIFIPKRNYKQRHGTKPQGFTEPEEEGRIGSNPTADEADHSRENHPGKAQDGTHPEDFASTSSPAWQAIQVKPHDEHVSQAGIAKDPDHQHVHAKARGHRIHQKQTKEDLEDDQGDVGARAIHPAIWEVQKHARPKLACCHATCGLSIGDVI